MAPSGGVRLLPSRMKRCPAYCVGRLAAYACQRTGHEHRNRTPYALYGLREWGVGWEEHWRLYDNLRPCLRSRGTALYDFFFDREGRCRGPGRTPPPTEAAPAVAAILANSDGYGLEDARGARAEGKDEAEFLAACQQAARIAWAEAPHTPAEMLQAAQCFEYQARDRETWEHSTAHALIRRIKRWASAGLADLTEEADGCPLTPSRGGSVSNLERLACLLARRNATDKKITALIGRPATRGNVGEWIAQTIFGVELEEAANQRGFDGRFADGPLAGKTVNVKWYGERAGVIDINPHAVPDYYLVMTGPKAVAKPARCRSLPLVIAEVFLFDAPALVERLRRRGVRLGIGASVRKVEWEEARVYPAAAYGARLPITDAQQEALKLFTETGRSGGGEAKAAE